MLNFFRRHKIFCALFLVVFAALAFYAGAHNHADHSGGAECALCHFADNVFVVGAFVLAMVAIRSSFLAYSYRSLQGKSLLTNLQSRAPPQYSY
ncbi:MAG: hypothetical protein ACI9CF_001684 [Candidatus Omnitrophota bacterium]|jgi:hypothetical protein